MGGLCLTCTVWGRGKGLEERWGEEAGRQARVVGNGLGGNGLVAGCEPGAEWLYPLRVRIQERGRQQRAWALRVLGGGPCVGRVQTVHGREEGA